MLCFVLPLSVRLSSPATGLDVYLPRWSDPGVRKLWSEAPLATRPCGVIPVYIFALHIDLAFLTGFPLSLLVVGGRGSHRGGCPVCCIDLSSADRGPFDRGAVLRLALFSLPLASPSSLGEASGSEHRSEEAFCTCLGSVVRQAERLRPVLVAVDREVRVSSRRDVIPSAPAELGRGRHEDWYIRRSTIIHRSPFSTASCLVTAHPTSWPRTIFHRVLFHSALIHQLASIGPPTTPHLVGLFMFCSIHQV
jgi:hypothetical protein